MTTSAPNDPPSPPRFRWLARIAVAYVVVALALAVVTAAWARRGVRIRDELFAACRAEGTPTSAADANARLDARATPEASDAGARLVAAAKRIAQQPRSATRPTAAEYAAERAAERWESEYDPRRPPSPADAPHLRAIVDRNAAALAEVEALLDGRAVDWPTRYRSPTFSTILPHLNALRDVARLLGQAASLAHADGDDVGALRHVERTLALADAMRRAATVLLDVTVARGTDDAACDAIEAIAAGLAVADDGRPGAAARADVERMIARLLDDGGRRDALAAAIRFERASMPIDAVETQAIAGPAWLGALARSAYRQSYRSAVAYHDAGLRALGAATLPEARALRVPEPFAPGVPRPPRPARVAQIATAIRGFLAPGIPSIVENAHVDRARRAACATLLAIRLYELDHGRLPPTLDALVPAHLPSVPRDTTDAAAPPIWYVDEGDLVAIYLPATPRPLTPETRFYEGLRAAQTRPTTFDRRLLADRSRRNDRVVVYRGHDVVKQILSSRR